MTAKTRVASLKLQTIPGLELCSVLLLARLLHHVRDVLGLSLKSTDAWHDSIIVIDWLAGNSRQFKPFVGNRVSTIVTLIPPRHWRHIKSDENPVDCASLGLFPVELDTHPLWWNGPHWLSQSPLSWPKNEVQKFEGNQDELKTCLNVVVSCLAPIMPFDCYSSFTK